MVRVIVFQTNNIIKHIKKRGISCAAAFFIDWRRRDTLNLYEVTNGYQADGYMYCLVVAANKKRAYELASIEFKKDARSQSYDQHVAFWAERGVSTDHLDEYNHPERYWTNLSVNERNPDNYNMDMTKEHATEIDESDYWAD